MTSSTANPDRVFSAICSPRRTRWHCLWHWHWHGGALRLQFFPGETGARPVNTWLIGGQNVDHVSSPAT
ncbi:unnamed protein product [Knipowitschia caucasica]